MDDRGEDRRNRTLGVPPSSLVLTVTLTAAALLVVGFVGIISVDLANATLRANVVDQTILWFCVAFVGYLGLTVLQSARHGHVDWRWLLVLGFGLRVGLLFVTTPTLSDDVYRYLWEGHLVTEGVSPYSFAIDSPLGDAYDISARSLANNPGLASPYLPVAHGLFGAAAVVLPSEPWTMQLLMIGFDVLAATMVLRLLRLADLPERRVLLYWLNPLVIIEVAHSAHIDAAMLGLAMAGLALTFDPKRVSVIATYGGPVLLAAAALTRPLAVLFVPVLLWVWTWRQRAAWAAALVVPILAVGASVGLGLTGGVPGTGVFGSVRAYVDTFRFNSGVYHWLERWIASQGLDDKGWNEPEALTRLIVAVCAVVLVGVVFVSARRDQSIRSRLRLAAVPFMVYVVLTPVLHPWYTLLLLGMLPFLAPGVDESGAQWLQATPWIGLSGLLIFSYLTYENPDAFAERSWVRRLEWYPTFVLLGLSLGWLIVTVRWRRTHAGPKSLGIDVTG